MLRVPQGAPEHPDPERLQVTPWLCESFCTEAVNDCDALTGTDELEGATVTEMAGAAVMVIALLADLEASLTDVAVSVTPEGLGCVGGAV